MNIGFVGLGRMGSHMARNLVQAGHRVTVHDVRQEAVEILVEIGAIAAPASNDVAAGAEFVFTSLPGPAEVMDVWQGEDGLLAHLESGAIGIDLSTIGPDTARAVESEAATRGRRFIDSPVSGGVLGAEAGTLSLMVGGSEDDFEEAFMALAAIGDPEKIYRCGDIGAGSVTKLVNNLIGMTTNVVVAEAFSMGVKAGVDAQVLFDVVSVSSGDSATLAQWEASVLKRNFTPGFMLALGHKDVRLALELAAQVNVPMPVTMVGKERLDAALAEGWGAEATAVVARLQEREASVVISGDTAQS
jgi:3-hydroxyisobutyrate dehydrogenase-like beta-hydroxyacid dehydrogenase